MVDLLDVVEMICTGWRSLVPKSGDSKMVAEGP